MTDRERDGFRTLIGESIGIPADRVSLFARGRVALYAILRALGIGEGDEVILPAFTCVAVPNAIQYTGARPVWVDIDPRTLCIDPAAVEAAIGPRTKSIIAQNTFGLSSDLDALLAIADRSGLTVIDDAAHGLGGRYRGSWNGATAPVSFFSTQWSKPISTGLGGIAVAQDVALAARLRAAERGAAEPSALRVLLLQTLIAGRGRVGSGRLFRTGRAAYRFLSRRHLVPGSSGNDELQGSTMPAGFVARLSEAQARLGSRRLRALPAEIARRRAIAHRYSDWLLAAARTPAAEPPGIEHVFLRYPLLVDDRPRFVIAARQAGIDLGDWFVSPVHPVVNGLERWGYTSGRAPVAERVCAQIVNLPVDPGLDEADITRVLRFLERHAGQIL